MLIAKARIFSGLVNKGIRPYTAYVVGAGQVSSGLVLNAGDTETVLSGGLAFATTVNNGGSLIVAAGGHAQTTRINAGPSEIVSAMAPPPIRSTTAAARF